MYFVSLHGQGTSVSPGSSGAPTLCRPGTYGASVSSTPNIGDSAFSGPMQYGMTYMVRPRIEPRYSEVMTAFMSAGAIQLLVAPASRGSTEQMNVRSSTLATSVGSDAHQNELGFFSGSSRVKVPCWTNRSVIRVHSSGEPSHHSIRSGVVSSATSRTQSSSCACRVGADSASVPGIAETVMP